MKKILLFLTAFLLTITALAQNEQHLQFKGIPIDGNYKTFSQELVNKGLRIVESTDDYIVLTGSFAGQMNTDILVYPDPSTKIVTSVVAMLKVEGKWGHIENLYNGKVDLYKEKYGLPTEQTEGFTDDVYSDYSRVKALENGQCNYKTTWVVNGGEISILPCYVDRNYYILCAYRDSVNTEAYHQSIIDDI